MTTRSASGLIIPSYHGFVPYSNFLVNGGFEIWQRGLTPAATTGPAFFYTADRWFAQTSGSTTHIAVAASTGRSNSNGGISNPYGGSRYCLSAVVTNLNGLAYVQQYLKEPADLAALAGRYVVFSIDVYQTVANTATIQLSAAAPGSGGSPDAPITITTPGYATAGQWVRMSVKGRIPLGVTQINAIVFFTANGTYYLDNASITIGQDVPYFAPVPIYEDLIRCQRYYEYQGIIGNPDGGFAPATVSSAATRSMYGVGDWYWYTPWNTVKGGAPSVYSPGTAWNASGSVAGATVSIYNVDPQGYTLKATGTSASQGIIQTNGTGYITAEWNP